MPDQPAAPAGLPDLADLVDLAVELACRAGALVRRGRAAVDPDGTGVDLAARLGVDTKSSPTDVVTEMDRASERMLSAELRARRPDDAILGEEGAASDGSSGVRWLVDPIDGTVNYLYGLPVYAVSVAAEVNGRVVAGAVHNPESGETFRAVRGGGAWLGDRRLTGPAVASLDQALVGTGFSYDAAVRAEQARVVAALLPRVRDVRRLGAASLDLCFAAAGRLDAYFERGLSPWDYAAGCLVAREAGLVVHGLRGRPAGPWFVLAAGAGVAGDLAGRLEDLAADGTTS
ncbi:MAG TPA: inositol monophosphatase family protein [Mycobacteriales bacterium]|nr:inositol monophosphatase family protein [Mycobacteriales bacterium]